MATTTRTDPLRNFKFQVAITKAMAASGQTELLRAGFMSVSGIGAQVEAIPYREGGYNTTMHKLPGQTQFADIRLSRGMFDNTDAQRTGGGMWNWFKELFYYQQGLGPAPAGNNFRTNIIIYLLDHPVTKGGPTNDGADNTPGGLARVGWKLYNAWPTQLTFSDLDAGGNQISVEQVSLAYEGFDLLHANGTAGINF